MSQDNPINRRKFLRLASLSAASSILAAVGQKCESEMNVPRESWRILRGKWRHAIGSASIPASR